MSAYFDRLAPFRDRLPNSRAIAAPLIVSLGIVASWAALAAMALSPVIAGALVLPLGLALLAAWLRYAYETALAASKASGGLLTQIGVEQRGSNRRLAIYDPSSGLYNRWYLELRLQEEFLRCNRYDLSMALICIKLSDVGLTTFSLDAWGSLASELARLMGKSVRAVDITAALAPLEFAICLVHCDRKGADLAIARLLRELDGRPADIGLAVYPDDNCDGKALIELARGRARTIGAARPAA